MKKLLEDFIPANFIAEVTGNLEQTIENIETNSKKITKCNNLFVALQGVFVNGEDFIGEAITKGAKAILVSETFDLEKYKNVDIIFVKILDLNKNFGTIVNNF